MDDRSSAVKDREKRYHDEHYAGDGPLPAVVEAEIRTRSLKPCYATGSDKYSDNRQAFHEIIDRDGGWTGKNVLDYACGRGTWAVYYALTGARRAAGFDISETAVRRGRERVERQGLGDRVDLRTMDATRLEYADDTFEVVIGVGVLHHVIKYPGIFEELHRVMKPGARAYFLEGLADFPPFRLWWKIKGEIPQGDVPIFSREVRDKASMFSDIVIHGDTFLYSAKTFLWKPSPGPGRKLVLRTLKAADDLLFRVCPPLRRCGSFSYIVLTK
jgi:SAM-dependent methyltransferase